MASENKYTNLIAGAHRGKERFTQWVYEITRPMVEAQAILESLVKKYDVDYAEGACLDAVGVRVGITRNLSLKLTDVFFALDDVEGIGFDLGIWQTAEDDAYGVTVLSDGIYRILIKAKIALNQYGGRNDNLEELIAQIQKSFGVSSRDLTYTDNQDMSITVGIAKENVPPILWAIFYNGVLSLNHAGVRQTLDDHSSGVLATTKAVPITTATGDTITVWAK